MIEEYKNRQGPLGYFDEMNNEPIEIGPQATAEEIEEQTGMILDDDEGEEEGEEEEHTTEERKEKESPTNNNEKIQLQQKENDTSQDKIDNNQDVDKNNQKKHITNEDQGKEQLEIYESENKNNTLKRTNNDNENNPIVIIISEEKNKNENSKENKTKPNKRKRKKREKPPIILCVEDKESELPKNEEKELTIVVIGDQKCGKSSLISRYIENKFQTKSKTTKEIIENKTKIAKIEGKNITIKMVDTPPIPNNKYTKMVQEQISKAHIVLYVFDLGEEDPLFKIKINCLNYTLKSKTLKVIVGNKLDQQTTYSDDNKKAVEAYSREKDYLWDFISCSKFTQELFDKWFEMKVIPEYFIRKNENNLQPKDGEVIQDE